MAIDIDSPAVFRGPLLTMAEDEEDEIAKHVPWPDLSSLSHGDLRVTVIHREFMRIHRDF